MKVRDRMLVASCVVLMMSSGAVSCVHGYMTRSVTEGSVFA